MNNLWMKMCGAREVKKVRTMLSVLCIMNFLTSFYMFSSAKKTNSSYNSILAIPELSVRNVDEKSWKLQRNRKRADTTLNHKSSIHRRINSFEYGAYMHSYIPIWFVGPNGEYISVHTVDYYVSDVILYDVHIPAYTHIHRQTMALVRDLERILCFVYVSVCEVVKLKLHDVMKSICNIGDYEKLNIWKADSRISDVLVSLSFSLSV